jgi:uncharacterized protein (TIGR03437 family)
VIDAAAGQPLLSPGGIMSIYGSNLADGVYQATTLPLPFSLGDVEVTVNGEIAALFYVSPDQINFQAPTGPVAYYPLNTVCLEVPLDPATLLPINCPAPAPAAIVVIESGVLSAPASVPVSTSAPAVFTQTDSVAIATHANGQLITQNNPAQAGETIVLYGEGLGYPMCNIPIGFPSGTDCLANGFPEMTFPDYPSLNDRANLLFAGLTPGAAGLAQFNLQLPASLPAAALAIGSIRLRIGDPTSGQTVQILLPGGSGSEAPATIQIVSGNSQTANAGQPFGAPLVVQVLNAQGSPATATVNFAVISGSASVASAAINTGSDGTVSQMVTAGPIAGPVTITASTGSLQAVFNLTVAAASTVPAPQIFGVSNLFSQTGSVTVSPGELLDVVGSNLGGPSGSTFNFGQYPTQSGGTQVLFDGAPAPILSESPNEVTAVVPFGLMVGATTKMTIVDQNVTSAPVQLTVAAATPGLLALSSSPTQLMVTRPDGSTVSASNPARLGEQETVYLTGAGALNPPQPDGLITGTTLSSVVLPVAATIGGVAVSNLQATSAPNQVAGYDQAVFSIPTNTPTGSVPFALTVGGVAAMTLYVPVQ